MITSITNTSNKLTVYIYFIDSCNYSCYYCYNIKPRTAILIDINSLLTYLNTIHTKYNKFIDVILIGGEPTLHPDLLTFVDIVYNQFKFIQITCFSNFSKSIEFYIKLLEKNVSLTLSWHIENTQFVDKLQNSLLLKYKDKLTVLLMYEPKYIDYVLSIYLNLKTLYKNVFIALLSLQKNEYTDTDIQKYQSYTNSIDKEHKSIPCICDSKQINLSYIEIEQFAENNNFFYNWLCFAGIESQYIHCDGKIYKCQSAFWNNNSLGSIYTTQTLLKNPQVCRYKHCRCELEITKKQIFKK